MNSVRARQLLLPTFISNQTFLDDTENASTQNLKYVLYADLKWYEIKQNDLILNLTPENRLQHSRIE